MTEDFQKPFTAPPVIFGAALLLGLALTFAYPVPMLPLTAQLSIGLIVIAAGVILIRNSMKAIDLADTTYDPFSASTALVTTGIYRFTRNPGYLGLTLIQIGLALMIDSFWIVLTGLVAVLVTTKFVIKLEEKKLERSFGQEYEDYLRKVRRWL
ncbi:MAG: methyltransferase family protein [Paracoccaceae bacterium]